MTSGSVHCHKSLTENLAEWRVTGTGWIQAFCDPDRHSHGDGLRDRGLVPGSVELADRGVRLSSLTDPDANRITFIENFRIEY
jgi:glyoxylase I family protein